LLYIIYIYIYLFICDTGAWTQGQHLEPLHQPFFFLWRVLKTICQGWLQSVILLISTSGVARIIGVSPRCLACFRYFWDEVLHLCSGQPGCDSPIYTSHSSKYNRNISSHPAFYWLRWGLANNMPMLVSNWDPPNTSLPNS
jgi:hypothetical protein